jgi:membrane-bound lytic murein transglycosylase MltF
MSWLNKRLSLVASFPLVVVVLLAVGCQKAAPPEKEGGQQSLEAGRSSQDQTLSGEAGKSTQDLTPLLDLETSEVLKINQPWLGDFDQIASGQRRFIRALVPYNRTLYYNVGPEQRGAAYESLREFERVLGEKTKKGAIKPKIIIIPTTRDRLVQALSQGLGDLAIGGFTVSEAGKKYADFSVPTVEGIKHVVVTGPSAAPVTSLEDLSGKEVHVRKFSTYYVELTTLNDRFKKEGKAPVKVRPADELLEDEDLLQMIDAGIIPITVVKDLDARFWAQLYDKIKVHDDVTLLTGGQLAWALRKNTPGFKQVVDDFVRTHRVGTVFGNIMLKRYLGSIERLKNPISEQELKKFRAASEYLKKYAGQYGLDWVLVGAQGYQESQLDQNRRSRVGAVGVMQIKPDTAAGVGVRGIERIDNNIHAGVKYLRFIVDRYFKDEPMDRLNKGLFAFASYNAGPARIARLRTKATQVGLNPNVWFNNVEIVAGREIGKETVDYVSNIYKYYTVYKSLQAQRELRSKRMAGLPEKE